MEQLGESGEISNNVESEEGRNSPKDRQRKRSDLSSVVSEIMGLREDPETMEAEVERILGGFIDRRLTLEKQRDPCTKNWDSANEVYPSVTRRLGLQLMDGVSPLVLTGEDIKGKDGNSIRVVLFDTLTGLVVDSGPVASAEVEILVFETTEARGENKALLGGDVYCTLTNGVGVLHPIKIRHTKRWMTKRECKLVVRILDDFPGIQVEEAMTEPFEVEDKRGKLYQKSYPPYLSHEVWRVEGIGKDGAFHNRLREKNIDTVQDILVQLNTNPQWLAKILRVSTTSKMWEVVVRHARTCVLDEGAYLFYPPISQQRIAVVFDVVGQLKGLLMEHQFVPSDELSTTQKADAQKLVVSAFQQWEEVVPVDDVASLIAGYQQLPYHPDGSDFETSDTVDLYGNTPQDTSLMGDISHGDTSYAGDFDLLGTGNLDCISSQHFCLQGTTVYSGVGEAGLVTPDTNYETSSFFGNNEENDHGNLYGTHSPFQDDMSWGLDNLGASSHDILPSPNIPWDESFLSSDNFHKSNNSHLTYAQLSSSVGPVSSSSSAETDSMFQGFFVDEQLQDSGSHSSLLPGNGILELQEGPGASSCSASVAVPQARKRTFNRKNAQRRWKILYSIMRWISVRRDVTGRTSSYKDRTALSRAVAMNKVQRRYMSKSEKAQARWRMLFSAMRLISVKRNVGTKIRVRDMLKDLSVSSPGDVPSHYSTGDTDRRHEHNLSFLAGFSHGDHVQFELPIIPLLNSAALGMNKSNRRYMAKRKAQRRWRMLFSVVRWFSVRRNVNEKGRLLLMGCT